MSLDGGVPSAKHNWEITSIKKLLHRLLKSWYARTFLLEERRNFKYLKCYKVTNPFKTQGQSMYKCYFSKSTANICGKKNTIKKEFLSNTLTTTVQIQF